MLSSKTKEGKFIKRVDFVETVKDIPAGETHSFTMIGTVYTGLTTACSRLKACGYEYKIKSDSKTNQIFVKRLK